MAVNLAPFSIVQDFVCRGLRHGREQEYAEFLQMPKLHSTDFVYAGGSEMAVAWVEALVSRLNSGVFRIVPLLSLAMYLILAILSDSRRREDKDWKRGWKRVLVWVAYQLTDWGPAYVIGNLYLDTEPHKKMIVAFWVSFLLLHHARPDNISAYAVEDTKLSVRLFVLDIPLAAGSCFVVWRYILAECTAGWFLCRASVIMLTLGILKFLDGMLALWRSDLGRIRKKGLSNKQTVNLDDYSDQGKLPELGDEEALLVAHDLFEICKGAFCDYKAKMDDNKKRSMFTDRWKSMCKVVEMELSLMYDILYTKASVVHTWHGYAIRVASPPLTATALLLFYLPGKKDMEGRDKVVSYILLCTTLFLDLIWLFGALASAWTHSYFKSLPHNWLKHELCCQGGWKKLRYWGVSQFLSRLSVWLWTCACPKDPKSYRRWAGTFGQRNLLDQCTAGNRHNLSSISRLPIESEDHSRGLEIPELVKELVFKVICAELFPTPKVPTETVHGENRPQGPPDRPDPDNPECTSNVDEEETSGPPVSGIQDGTSQVEPPWTLDWLWNWPFHTCLKQVPAAKQHNGIDTNEPPGTLVSGEQTCNGMDEPPLRPLYPREQIFHGMDNEPPPLPPCPREWICSGMDNVPPAWPHHCPDEEAAMTLSGSYEQRTDDRWRYVEAQPETYEQACLWRNVHAGSMHDQPMLNKPNNQAASPKPWDFPPELQEAILIWHIATDVFLHTAALQDDGDAIKKMSDYMVFLLAKRPSMLPGLKLRSLYENARTTLKEIGKIKEKVKPSSRTTVKAAKELAAWMLKKVDDLKDPNSAIWEGKMKDHLKGLATLWEGTQIAQVLLSRIQDGKHDQSETTAEEGVQKLAYWIPGLLEPHQDLESMLKFILEAWVHLLMYASIRGSREAHADQLSRGGGLTTLVWIITEHAEDSVVRSKCPSFFVKNESVVSFK